MSHLPGDPLPPLPVLPLPVEPYHFPPVNPQHSGRPGAITFIAVTSIVIASLGILASAGFAFMDFGILMASSAAKSMPTPATPAAVSASSVITGGTTERLPFSGLAYSDRQTFEMGIQRVRVLSPEQLDQLDELLAQSGKTVNGDGPVLLPDQLAGSVTSSGHHAFGDTPGSDYFVLGNGRLELSSDRAVFFPTGGLPSIYSNAIVLPTPAYGVTPKSLQPYQIRSIVRTVNDLNGGKIKSAQAKTFVTTLQSPGEDLILPTTDGTDPAYEITSVSTDSDGTLTVACKHGAVSSIFSCDASGVDTSPISVTDTATTSTGPIVDKTAGLTALSLTVAQIIPAIFLLITGILTLRYSPRGRLLHWIYVAMKLPLAIACAAVSFWMWSSAIHSAMPTSGPGAPTAQAAATGSAMVGVMLGIAPDLLGCIWPIVLIFMLMSKNVRLYYAAGVSPVNR
jgi:hypothetical protein